MGVGADLLDLQADYPKFEACKYVFKGNSRVREEDVARGVQQVKDCVAEIYKLGKNVVNSYIRIGALLQMIERNGLYTYVRCKSNLYKDIYEFAFKVFGFSKNTTYSLLNVTQRFVVGNEIKPGYQGFSYSKLVELLPVEEERVRHLTSDITVSEIRELRKIWDKYGYDSAITWKDELQRGRERLATEEEAARQKAKSERKSGILEMLTQSPPSQEDSAPPEGQSQAVNGITPRKSPFEFGQVEVKQYKSTAHRTAQKVTFKNDTERKEFLSAKNCKTWQLWLDIPELDLKFYRFDFINGDYLIAEYGYYYPNYVSDTTKAYGYFKLHLQTKEHPKFDCEGLAETYILQYLKSHAKEI